MLTLMLSQLRNLPSKSKTNIIIGVIVLIVIWFVLPHISLNHSRPFASMDARLMLTGLGVLIAFLPTLFNFINKHRSNVFRTCLDSLKAALSWSKKGSQKTWHSSKENLHGLKQRLSEDRKRRKLRKLPWYLVLGSEGAGKKTVIQNTGLRFARADYFGHEAVNYINKMPDMEWWFSEQAVMIDPMTYDKDTDLSALKKLVKLLKKERKNKPLNGIILTFSLTDLLTYSNQQRQEKLQEICTYIREVHAHFRSLIPVYVIFNKCDLVEGFMEFFNQISKEELNQVWGMTLPVERCSEQQFVFNFFDNQYNDMLETLRQQVMWALETERSPRGRELILSYPQQMQLFKRPIHDFLLDLFTATRYQKALQLRGIYFTSCNQDSGEPMDFLMAAMSKKFQLVQPSFERPARLGQCFFMRRLFPEVISPEASFLGQSERSKRRNKLVYRALITACPLCSVAVGVGMYNGYQDNQLNLKMINNLVDQHNQHFRAIDPQSVSLTQLLPTLSPLDEAYKLYTQKPKTGLSFIYTSQVIEDATQGALYRTLQNQFLPRVALQLESMLQQNTNNNNILYAALKGYLSFSQTSYALPQYIVSPMELQWREEFLQHPNIKAQLRHYAQLSTHTTYPKLALNTTLIRQVRTQLEQILPSNRAYGLLMLRGHVSELPAIQLGTSVGDMFYQTFSSSQPAIHIPALYTRKGFESIFLPHYEAIAHDVAQDNHDIGLIDSKKNTAHTAEQISTLIQSDYTQHYIQLWTIALDHIHMQPFHSLPDAIHKLSILSGKNSPMLQLLTVVQNNTNPVTHDQVNVASHFEAVNAFTENDSEVNWANVSHTLSDLKDYLVKIQNAPDPSQAFLKAAKEAMKGTQNPIQKLSMQASKAPPLVRQWLMTIANSAWDIVVQSAHKELNQAWQNQVLPTYAENLQGRYPLAPQADSQIALADFNHFYGKSGVLSSYFTKYIEPFVNSSSSPWKEYSVHHHSIELPRATIQLFERLHTVQSYYFNHKDNKASFSFSVKPYFLDPNTRQVSLTLGSKSLLYSYGPRQTAVVQWPFNKNNLQSSITIVDFDQHQYIHNAFGPWSLFKILDRGLLHQTANNGSFILSYKLGGYMAKFELNGINSRKAFLLTPLKGFDLPQQLAPSQPTGV